MKKYLLSILLYILCFSSIHPQAKKKNSTNVFLKLSRTHPRLIIKRKLIDQLKSKFGQSELLTELILGNNSNSDEYINEKPPVYIFVKNKFNTNTNTMCNRILSLTVSYLLTKKKEYLKRAILEMKAIGKLSTWNSKHRHDYGRLVMSFSLCYDWLFNSLSKKNKETFRQVINKKCILEGIKYYKENSTRLKDEKYYFHATPHYALLISSLVIGSKNNKNAITLYKNALKYLKKSQKEYEINGSFYAGHLYWAIQTFQIILAAESLKSALGHTGKLISHKGFSNTPKFILYNYSNTNLHFNYADAQFNNPSKAFWILYWFSKTQKNDDYITLANDLLNIHTSNISKQISKLSPLSILFFHEAATHPKIKLPLDKIFRGKTQIAIFRSEWRNPNAIWLGMKAGKINLTYSQMDIGSFELDADGERWAIDLGKEQKHSSKINYWDRKPNGSRWKYYRTSSKSHNTLTFKNSLQNANGEGKFTNFVSTSKNAYAIIDMKSTYKGQASRVNRGFAFLNRKRVLIQDEIENAFSEVRWAFITPASVELDGNKAVLIKNDKKMYVEVLSPKNINFKKLSTAVYLDKNQMKNTGKTMVAFTIPKQKNITIKVLFTPGSKIHEKFSVTMNLPLQKWPKGKAIKKSKKK
ncbi:MAG: hypothetical protein COA79_05300 [Planctomycetota bacterium]|nr:MAG: hypothetical protein COA79_05300 [Planctomycetota bacterium]